MTLPTDGFLWLLAALIPLVLLQPRLQRELQSLFLLITRRQDVSTILFSLILLPGVILHELSHFLAAKLLFVRTGRVSVFPRRVAANTLQLGYVEVAQSDPIRATLIGIAPLLTGSAFVAWAGLLRLGLLELYRATAAGGTAALLDALIALPSHPDAFLWLYLCLAVSSTMFPSPSDRRALLPFLGILLGVLALLWLIVGTERLVPGIVITLNNACRAIAVVFGLTAALHALFLVPIVLLRRAVEGATGMRVVRK